MSDTPDLSTPEIARFARRAVALLVHYGERDVDGLNAVLEEVKGPADCAHLVVALLGLIEHLAPQTYTPAGIAIARSVIPDLAHREHQ